MRPGPWGAGGGPRAAGHGTRQSIARAKAREASGGELVHRSPGGACDQQSLRPQLMRSKPRPSCRLLPQCIAVTQQHWSHTIGCDKGVGAAIVNWPRGPMDKASAYGAGDCRFESCRGHFLMTERPQGDRAEHAGESGRSPRR